MPCVSWVWATARPLGAAAAAPDLPLEAGVAGVAGVAGLAELAGGRRMLVLAGVAGKGAARAVAIMQRIANDFIFAVVIG
jgi:hypothetical protein